MLPKCALEEGITMKNLLFIFLFLIYAQVANAAVPDGRVAFVNDASASQDADDVAAIPFQAAMMAAFDATDKLVHWSYNCDYTGAVIAPDRVGSLETSLLGGIDLWGDPVYGDFNTNMIFDCRDTVQRNAAIAHLAARINESSAADPLWIIEAGEPDVIGYALEAATQSKRQYVKVVTHHTHNDNGVYWDLEGNIAALPGMATDFIVRIPDQNVNLKKAESQFGWMTNSTDPRIEFLASRYSASTVWDWNPQPGTVDISDAGMVWYVLSGGPDGGGSINVTPAEVGTKITTWAAAHPTAAPPPPPPLSDDYYMETNGLVVMDVEFVDPMTGWTEDTRIPGFTGSSYYVATGFDSFTTPGKSILTYKFAVTKSGSYQLQWRSAITDKNGGFFDLHSEHNDSWAQMLNASGAVVAPDNAASLDGGRTDSSGLRWFKAYTNVKNTWSWQASNVDGGPLSLYWTLQPGQVYEFRVSLRSQGHAIDRIVLWDRSLDPPYGPDAGKPTSSHNSLLNSAPVSPIVQSAIIPVVNFVAPSGNTSVDIGSDLHVQVNATSAAGISEVALYKDDVLIRLDSTAPYEWGLADDEANDLSLRNLQSGSFVLKAIARDAGTNTAETSIIVTVEPRVAAYFTYTGGTGDWERSGNWSSGLAWNGPFTGTTLWPSSIDDFTLGVANVTLNSEVTVDDYRVGDGGASPGGAGSLTLAAGSTLITKAGAIGYNRGAAVTIRNGAQLNHSADLVVGYRGSSTVEVYGTLRTRDLKLQYISANPRAAVSVINVRTGGVITVSRNLQIGGDDGTANFTGLNGTLNILEGGVVTAAGWDLRAGAHIVISEGGQLRISGDQVTVANGYIASGYITSTAQLSVTYTSGETLISAIVPSGYEIWAATNGIGNATADDDQDGRVNLLEYAIGGNPKAGGDTEPAMVMIGNSLHYSFNRRNDDPGLVYILQGSPDLKSTTWTNLAPALTLNEKQGNYDNITLTIAEDGLNYFIRLKVVYP